ncbi:unnamed protein product [Caenorhabditis sp. 36 PRJEB53466]|nr:unnamed protein product [Caenorhabditis sp. 36 PRJEB53466]
MNSKNRRSSILKTRQQLDPLDETTNGNGAPGFSVTTIARDRRVSFLNTKQVQQYDRDHGRLYDESPLKEKISTSINSDGVLTPGRNTSETTTEKHPRLFGNGLILNGTADMSLETVKENDPNETMQMFNLTTVETVQMTRTTVTEQVVERHAVPQHRNLAEETMDMFNTTDYETRDMSVDQSRLFAVPQLPARTANAQANDTMSIFNVSTTSNYEMDISMFPNNGQGAVPSVIPAFPAEDNSGEVDMEMTLEQQKLADASVHMDEPMDITATPTRIANKSVPAVRPSPAPAAAANVLGNANDTMSIFNITNSIPQDMDITNIQNFTRASMDISAAPIPAASETMRMFHVMSPGRPAAANDEDMEMDITQPPETPLRVAPKANQTPKLLNKTSAAPHDMDISNVYNPDISVQQPETPKPATIPEQSSAQLESVLEGKEEGRNMLQSSMMMDLSSIHDFSYRSLQSVANQSAERTSPAEPEDEETTMHYEDEEHKQQKTMEVKSQKSIHEDSVNESMTTITQKSILERTHSETIENISQKSHLGLSFPSSAHSRRRSLLNESTRFESPRRVALENSMITNMTAISERRGRKSLQLNQQSVLNSSVMNDTVKSLSGRDIFAMNTSLRSPLTPRAASAASVNASSAPPTPEVPYQMPNFDPAVTNIIWLTPDENEKIPPEAAKLDRLIATEKTKTEENILSLEQNVGAEKMRILRSGVWSQLSHDEKDVVRVARQKSEMRFLNLRYSFASDCHRSYDQQVSKLETENARIAEQLAEAESVEEARRELEELKNRPTLADYQKVESEFKEAKKMAFECQLAAVRQISEELLEMRKTKTALETDIEEKKEKLARMGDLETKKMKEMEAKLEEIMQAAINSI